MKGRILNKKTNKIPSHAIYIGRGSKYGNPYRIGIDGSREDVIEKYRYHLLDMIDNGDISIEEVIELYEYDLVCYCAPLPCHGNIIHEFGKFFINEGLR